MRYSYYPGCSLTSTGLEYGLSLEAIFHHLEIELVELPGWNCCGASSAHALSHTLPVALPARNLALAQAAGDDLVVPCAACFNRLRYADYALNNQPGLKEEIEGVIQLEFGQPVAIKPALAVLYQDFGVSRLSDRVRLPLTGLHLAAYYGCLLVRPPQIVQFDHPDNPQVLPGLMRAVGAEPVNWSHATDCCGAGLSLSRADIVESLVTRLVERAREAGAQALVTACPLCQVNIEMRQTQSPKMPSFYFSELIGLALGLPEASKWWRKHLIDPRPLLNSLEMTAFEGGLASREAVFSHSQS